MAGGGYARPDGLKIENFQFQRPYSLNRSLVRSCAESDLHA